jgi:hypothetical protein
MRPIRRAGKRPQRKLTPDERLHAIMPTFVWNAQKALGKHPVAITSSGELIETLDAFLRLCASRMSTTSRSLYRWRDRFLSSGGAVEALRDRPRSDKGVSRLFQGRTSAVAVICGLHAQGRTPTEIYNTLAQIWPDLYPGSRVPSYATVRAFIIQSLRSPNGATASRATRVPS